MPVTQEGLAKLIEREALRDHRIAQAFRSVDRADFVPPGFAAEAYGDRPVGLPERQTTSQPSLIARMIDAASPGPMDTVLEVGTGYGFQTALLARLSASVVSIERHSSLAEAARENLVRHGAANVEVLVGDGWKGCPQKSPFDVIVVSAAAVELPEALVDQLAEGGRLVIPLARGGSDDVVLLRKGEGRVAEERLITPARFVPLVRDPEGATDGG